MHADAVSWPVGCGALPLGVDTSVAVFWNSHSVWLRMLRGLLADLKHPWSVTLCRAQH